MAPVVLKGSVNLSDDRDLYDHVVRPTYLKR